MTRQHVHRYVCESGLCGGLQPVVTLTDVGVAVCVAVLHGERLADAIGAHIALEFLELLGRIATAPRGWLDTWVAVLERDVRRHQFGARVRMRMVVAVVVARVL